MLSPADAQLRQMIAALGEAYSIAATRVEFLPHGADADSAAFRAEHMRCTALIERSEPLAVQANTTAIAPRHTDLHGYNVLTDENGRVEPNNRKIVFVGNYESVLSTQHAGLFLHRLRTAM